MKMIGDSKRVPFLLVLLLSLVCMPALAKDKEKKKEKSKKQSGLHLSFKERPTLQIGEVFRIDFRSKLQWDFSGFSPHLQTEEGASDLSRVRFGVKGEVFKFVEYEAEREFRETFGGRDSKRPWRDVYVNSSYWDDFQVKTGKFKIPFSLEALTGSHELDFVNRSRIADQLAPFRDIGVMVHGKFFKKGLSYEAGVFRNDGEKNDTTTVLTDESPGNRTVAGRVTATPLRLLHVPEVFKKVELGAAVTETDVPEGLNSLRGHTNSGYDFFHHIYVKGRRSRVGTELSWTPGPFSAQGEFIHVSEARENQSISGGDLPAKISRGWYLTGTWVVTGEKKQGGIKPRRPFLDGGFGAVEVAGRYEQLRFGSAEHIGRPFNNPRSSNILPNSDRVWTLGVNWYLNHYAKIQVNGIQETIEDVNRSPIPGQSVFRMGIVRLQFSM